MFGLSMREVLINAIINASINCKHIYKDAIIRNIATLNDAENESDVSTTMLSIRKEYLDAVWNSVISTFKVSSPTAFSKIQFIITSPSICGYKDIHLENGAMAGSLFAICYYALKNKVAPSKDCIKLNHFQNDIMNQVLLEVDKEL
jgi:hypothetical protein